MHSRAAIGLPSQNQQCVHSTYSAPYWAKQQTHMMWRAWNFNCCILGNISSGSNYRLMSQVGTNNRNKKFNAGTLHSSDVVSGVSVLLDCICLVKRVGNFIVLAGHMEVSEFIMGSACAWYIDNTINWTFWQRHGLWLWWYSRYTGCLKIYLTSEKFFFTLTF